MNKIIINKQKPGSIITWLVVGLLVMFSCGCATAHSDETTESISSAYIHTDLYSLSKHVDAMAEAGETITYRYILVPEVKLGSVVVKDKVPATATLVSTSPQASIDGENVTWALGTVHAGERVVLTLRIKANEAGVLKNCAYVTAVPLACTTTVVGKPSITVTKIAPDVAYVGQKIDFIVNVTNDGTSEVRHIVVTDPVPEGLSSQDGTSSLMYDIGDLHPGETRRIIVPMIASQRGQHTNVANISTANAGNAKAEAAVNVLQPDIKITKTGTEEQFIDKTANYVIKVENTGDTTLHDIDLVDRPEPPVRIVSAEGADIRDNAAVWRIGTLDKGQNMSYAVQTTSHEAGTYANVAKVFTSTGKLRQTSQMNTRWNGIPGLLVQLTDTRNPIAVGEETSYLIRITNQGSATDTSIVLVAHFPDEIDPIDTTGFTAGKVDGKTVTFEAIPSLPGKEVVEYRIRARAVKTSTDTRMKVGVTSDFLKTPVTEEESIHVY